MGKTVRAAAWAVLLLGSTVAFAQFLPPAGNPEPERLRVQNPVPLPGLPGAEPAAPFVDSNVDRAQQLLPPVAPPGGVQPTIPDSPRGSVPAGVVTTPALTSPTPSEPPPPTVRIQVQTPAHVAPGKPIPYKVVVSNPSSATAYRVRVRVPAPDGAATLTKAEPKPDNVKDFKVPAALVGEMTWEFKSLNRGEQKVIELEFTPQPGVKDVRARAYVSFEHGQEVVTQIEKPKLTVKKVASKDAARGEPVTVRVEVTNAGPMPIHKVRLVEVATPGFDFKTSADAVQTKMTNERAWDLGTLGRGQSKIVTYQLTGGRQQGGELLTTSHATSEDGGIAETAESKTRILVPELGFTLTGPASVESKKPAEYEATARNNGTLPLTNVVVSIPIPEDCQPTKVTKDAQRYKDRVSWVIPKMTPGEAYKFRLTVTANTSGKRVVRATARDKAGAVDAEREVATAFLGRADLHWSPNIPAILALDKQGQIVITVRNDGEEADAGVAPRVRLPDGLKVIETTPSKATVTKEGEIVFSAVEIKPGKTEVFTVTVQRTQPGQKRVGLQLNATSLDNRPLLKDQTIE